LCSRSRASIERSSDEYSKYIFSGVHTHEADLFDPATLCSIQRQFAGRCALATAFPPCTDLSIAGARWWAGKAAKDPEFQRRGAERVVAIAILFGSLDCKYMIENLRTSALNTIWRKADFIFQPFEYGGYLPCRDVHPWYPREIPRT
jgi:hypothetical protein